MNQRHLSVPRALDWDMAERILLDSCFDLVLINCGSLISSFLSQPLLTIKWIKPSLREQNSVQYIFFPETFFSYPSWHITYIFSLNLLFSILTEIQNLVIFWLAISSENSSNDILQCINLVIIIAILFFNSFYLLNFWEENKVRILSSFI